MATSFSAHEPQHPAAAADAAWPALPLVDEWPETYATLHRIVQIIGKTRLGLAPMTNHWWQTTLYVTNRGLTTSPMPQGDHLLEVELCLLEDVVSLRTNEGALRTVPLGSRPIADFYREYQAALRSLGFAPHIWPVPVELPDDATPFPDDRTRGRYDADAARLLFGALCQVNRVMSTFRGRFTGKCSPVHFFWGAFDLACTRFSGRRAPRHPGGVPHCPDYVAVEAYSHECISAGFWPGSGPVREAAFYSYAYPEPGHFRDEPILPEATRYEPLLGEFVLPYDAVRTASNPDAALLEFLESTYGAAADLAGWDRGALEMHPGSIPPHH